MIQPLAWLLGLPIRRPRATLLLAALLTAASILGICRLKMQAALDAMFPRNDPAAAALTRILDRFDAADELLVLVTLPADNPNADPDRLIAFAQRFQSQAAATPAHGVIYRAPADAERFVEQQLAPTGLFYLDDAQYAAAQARLTPQGMRQQLTQDQAMLLQPGPAAGALAKAMMKDPLFLHDFLLPRLAGSRPITTYPNTDALISPDGRSLLIRVLGSQPPTDLPYAVRLTDAITAAAARASPNGLLVQLAGAYPIAALSQSAIRRDAIESIVGSIFFLLGLFILVYRRPIRMFHLAFIPVAIGIAWGFGTYGLTVRNLNPIAAVIGGVLAGMGIDYTVLYLTRYQTLRTQGSDPPQAAMQTINSIGAALLAAFVTSIIGFLAIACSSVTALRDFALLGTMGLTGSFLAALFVLPSLLVLTDSISSSSPPPAFRFNLDALIRWGVSYRRLLFTTGGALTIACIAAAAHGPPLFHPDADLTAMHPRPNAALDAQLEIGRRFGVSAGTLLIHLRADDDQQLISLAYQVQRRLNSQSVKAAGITASYGLATWLPDPALAAQRRSAGSQQNADRVAADFQSAISASPFDIKAFDGYTSFLRLLLNPQHIPDLQTLRNYPGLAGDLLPRDPQGPSEAVTILWLTNDEEDRAAMDRSITAARAALAGLPGVTLTGLPVIGHDADATVEIELPRLMKIAAALVALYLLIHFRNPRHMILSLVPSIFGLSVLAALARTLGIGVNMVNLVALPLLIGIDVDYGIYLVSLARRQESSPHESSFSGGAHAVMVCATSIICGYASLLLTSVPAVQSLGLVVAAGVVSCLAGALFLLCPMLAESLELHP